MVFNLIKSSSEHESKSELDTLEKIRGKGIKVTPSLCKAYMKAGRYKVYREQISSLYIYGYGLFRRLFLYLGKEIAGKTDYRNENDIFYLSKEEIDSILEHIDKPDISRYHEVIRKTEGRNGRDKRHHTSSGYLW